MLLQTPLSEVLIAWQGLGYNRRAKMLYLAAKEVVENTKGNFLNQSELELFPGKWSRIPHEAVAAFGYNQPVVFIESNLRTVVNAIIF